MHFTSLEKNNLTVSARKKTAELFVFILYAIIVSYAMFHHEMWADELHSWNIAKASNSIIDLIHNTRFEGHPPVWYIILWIVSKFSHKLIYVQIVHLFIAITSIYLLLFFAPFTLTTKLLIPFGYYFLFEYAVLSRNYAIGVLLAFFICVILKNKFKNQLPFYYAALFFLSNTHLLAVLLAASIHASFLFSYVQQKKKIQTIFLHALIGAIILLPSVYFILPPSSSEMNSHFWLDNWNVKQLITIVQAPLRSFIPIPAWWNYSFWNTQFLLDLQSKFNALRIINVVISVTLILTAIWILKNNKKSLVLFITNLILTFITGSVFSLTSARYAGFIFLSFIIAYWLYGYETPIKKNKNRTVNFLLSFQLLAGIFVVMKDIVFPFSNSYKVNELVKQIPFGNTITTDYWTLNTLSAYQDKSFYCIDLQKNLSFLLWKDDWFKVLKDSGRYYNGIKNVFEKDSLNQLYMISINSPEQLNEVDDLLFKKYKVQLIDKREGAIEKGSNLYLYNISNF